MQCIEMPKQISIMIQVDVTLPPPGLTRLLMKIRGIPGITKVVRVPDEGPNRLYMAFCGDDADTDELIKAIEHRRFVLSIKKGRVL